MAGEARADPAPHRGSIDRFRPFQPLPPRSWTTDLYPSELRPARFRGKTADPLKSENGAMTYRAPINDMLLALNHGAGLEAAVKAGHYGDFDGDITAAVLEEAGRFASDVLAT